MEFATGALGTLLPKLGQLLKDEYHLQKGTKENIQYLSRELDSIRAALSSVGEVPREQLKEHVRIWARDVRELSYDMEDIVDTFLVRVQGLEPPSKRSAKRFIRKMMGIVSKATTRHEIAQEIKDIKERVKEVAERRERYKVEAITPPKTMVDPRIAFLYNDAADLVGIDEARDGLITRLTKGDAPYARKKIVSVVGFGGIGKTTLAKAAYEKIKGQFDCTAFVPFVQNPDLKKVFKDILINLDKGQYMSFNFSILDERELINEFHEFLDKKRLVYFIVIDDVWEAETWETIKLALVENNKGSRIIITTRKHEVARVAGEVFELQPLSDDNSRKLFFARIFGAGSKSSDHQPDDVSDKILRKCGGIPLAIITMGSLLVGKPREEWSEVHRSIGFGNKENRQVDNTMKILSFSYYDLPPHLRTCLLSLSVFPEDSFIEKGPLIWMWIAEGFVQEKPGISSFETGEGYFNELVNRNMIQLVEKYYWEWTDMVVCGCQVHDMVLDLICSISSEENFVTVLQDKNEGASSYSSLSTTTTTQGKVRRLALQNINRIVDANMDVQQVRSFISSECDVDKGVVPFISSLRHVLVLSIVFSRYLEASWSIYPVQKLLHLRYLRLCRNVRLPEKIGTLKFLQTLDVDQPLTSVGSLTQLLCLRIRCLISRVPDGIGKLTSLQELHIRYIIVEKDEPLRQFVKELGALRELRVLRLEILRVSSPYGRGVLMDMVESLRNLQRMNHLSLLCHGGHYRVCADTTTLEAWGFLLPRTMRQLCLDWIIFSRVPWFCINPSRLPYLSHLYLTVDYLDEQDMRVLGCLPELCELKVNASNTMSIKEMVCDTISTNDAACDECCLFPKLRRCTLMFPMVRFPPKGDSGGVSFCMRNVHGSMLLGSRGNDAKAGVAPQTLMLPSFQQLRFTVFVREFNLDCSSLVLQYFASLQNVKVDIMCYGASAAEVGAAETALWRAADVHPNRPTLKVLRFGEVA